jgi:hypothetical protein
MFETSDTSFHPKSWIFHFGHSGSIAIVGSSNLTETALRSGVEWNYRVYDKFRGFRGPSGSQSPTTSPPGTSAGVAEWPGADIALLTKSEPKRPPRCRGSG